MPIYDRDLPIIGRPRGTTTQQIAQILKECWDMSGLGRVHPLCGGYILDANGNEVLEYRRTWTRTPRILVVRR